MKWINFLALAGLLAGATITRAAVITVNTADNSDFSAGATNLVTALLEVKDGDTIAFDIPGAGPHYLQTPVGGFPLLIKDNVTIDGYTQPGAVANSNPNTAPNNAVINIVLDSRNGNYRAMGYAQYTLSNSIPPIDNTTMATERAGYGTNEMAILGVYRATNANIRGLAFLGDSYETNSGLFTYMIAVAQDYGLNTNVLDRLAYNEGSSRHCHINGCWFGVDPANQTPGGLTQTYAAIAFFRHRDRLGGTRQELPNESLIVGVKPGSANPRAEFNVIAYMSSGLTGEAIRTRFAGNFLGVMPDGVTPTGIPIIFSAGMEIGRFPDTGPMVFGTDGDGVNDADEGNLFGPLIDSGFVFDFYATGNKLHIVAGNRFGIDVNGARWTNSQTLFAPMVAGTTLRVGSDFDGVSDALEANVIYNNFPFDELFPDPANMLPPRLVADPNANSHVSLRGNTLVNNSLVPFDYADRLGGRLASFRNFSRVFLDTNSPGGIIPNLLASTQFRLAGNCASANLFSVYTNNLVIDVYVADPEGIANGLRFELPELNLTNGFPQGRTYLGSFQDNGPSDLNPAVGLYEFDIAALGLAIGTEVTVTANYSADPIGTHNGRVSTSEFSYPVALQAAPSYALDINPGSNLIANQLDHGSNTLDLILTNVPDNSQLLKWDVAAQDFTQIYTFVGSSSAWIPAGGTLSPGEAGFLLNPDAAYSITFTGSPHVPVLPVPLTRNALHYLSRQTADIGSWDSITGLPPEEGALLLRWEVNLQDFQTNRFTGGQWQPTNPVVNIGEGVVIWLPPPPPPLPTITCPADLVTNVFGSSVAVNYPNPTIADGTLMVCTPASGSLFPLGTNLVTCTATNDSGSNTCTFYVTVLQIGLPVISYTNSIPAGYSLIANQLDRGSNTLNEIMPVVPEGSHLFKYDNAVGIYLTANYYNGAWQPGNLTLNPGEGAFLYSPLGFSLILTGSPHVPVLPLSNSCAGFQLLSRQTNGAGTFDNILGVPPQAGDQVYKLTATGYSSYEFLGAPDGWEPSEPIIAVGEAVWIRQFTGPSCPGGSNPLTPPPVITTQPLGQTVGPGANVTFSVVAIGDPPLTYQWQLNGANISGETNTSLTVNNVQPTNSGAYSVVVANSGGALLSQIAALDVVTSAFGFADNFADRILITAIGGSGSGSNTNATKQAAEPDHAGNAGGRSVWLAWEAPANGIATFSTAGSSFDTLLAVYRGLNPGSFKQTASDDDSAGFYTSVVRFNAVAGVTYNIAVDGSYGASGRIVLTWDLELTTATVPEIATQPKPRLVMSETPFTLSVGAAAVGGLPLEYQWLLNDLPILGAVNASYTNLNALPLDAGIYRVQIRTPPPASREVLSRPVAVQLAFVQLGAFANVIAQDKFLDTTSLGLDLDSLLGLRGEVSSAAAPVGGFTGTQIFNTYAAAKEPDEPNHCGETGGASYWFAYQSPANGRLSVNTINSTFDTVLAVYSGPDPVTSFSSLSCVACANAAGLGNEVVEFDTTGGTIYYVAVDGVGGASGSVRLGYDMVTARPVIANQPQNTAVTAGQDGILSVAIANTSVTPLAYQWQFNSANLPAATQAAYTRPGFQASHQGNYRVVVTNLVGAVTSSIAMMYLDRPPIHATNSFINGGGFFESQWLGPTGSLLTVQVSTNLTNWSSVSTSTAASGYINYTDSTPAGLSRRYYRTLLAFP